MAAFLRPVNKDEDEEAGGFPAGPKVLKKPPKRTRRGLPKSTVNQIPAPTKESAKISVKTRLREADGADFGGGKFKVILIQEGLGNLRDCFYYTKECLQNSVQNFEGVKCFADHPNQIEEQIHPERSTRDVLGHYEDVEYLEIDGRGTLQATLILCEGAHFDWARSLLTNALDYSKKYSNAEFVGFSINAQGEAGSADLDEFLQSADIPQSALAKLQKAQADGISEIRPVSSLSDAVSVDLVTEAGAGGKILTMMEQERKPMKQPKKKPAKKVEANRAREANREAEEHEEDGGDGDGAAAGGADPGAQDHADAAQDVALFKKMIGQYLGNDSGVDEEEAMKMAQHAHEHFMKQGMEAHEAYEAAGNHLKAAAAIGKSMQGGEEEEEEEAHEAEEHEEAQESEEHEEAGDGDGAPPAAPAKGKGKGAPPMAQESRKEMIKLKAEVASLRESNRRIETARYLDKKLASADASPEFLKAFREALGKPRSIAHIEETWSVFCKAREAALSEGGEEEETILGENSSGRFRESGGGAEVISLKDCVR